MQLTAITVCQCKNRLFCPSSIYTTCSQWAQTVNTATNASEFEELDYTTPLYQSWLFLASIVV